MAVLLPTAAGLISARYLRHSMKRDRPCPEADPSPVPEGLPPPVLPLSWALATGGRPRAGRRLTGDPSGDFHTAALLHSRAHEGRPDLAELVGMAYSHWAGLGLRGG